MESASVILMSTGQPRSSEQGRRYEIPAEGIYIGAGTDVDIAIDDPTGSKARIHLSPEGSWHLQGFEQSHIYVNEVRSRRTTLSDGDLVQIGPAVFKFLSGIGLESDHYAQMYHLIVIDFLTQIYNRSYFMTQLDRELARGLRHHRPLSLVLLDLDYFKKINDTYGHLAGDALLREVAHAIQANVRLEDVFARYGGEEFVLLLPETTGEQAMIMAEKVRFLVEKLIVPFEKHELSTTVSLGVVEASGQPSAKTLIQKADANLYKAKQQGRNRVVGG